MDEDVAAVGVDALVVVVGDYAVVVFGCDMVHVFALASWVMNGGRVDNHVVVLTVFIAGKGGGSDVCIWYCGVWVGLYTKCFHYVQGVGRGEGIHLCCLTYSVFTYIYIGGEDFVAVDG